MRIFTLLYGFNQYAMLEGPRVTRWLARPNRTGHRVNAGGRFFMLVNGWFCKDTFSYCEEGMRQRRGRTKTQASVQSYQLTHTSLRRTNRRHTKR